MASFPIWRFVFTVITALQVSNAQLAPQPHVGSQCFHVKGVPTLNMRCHGGDLIRVGQSFYGSPPDNATCRYQQSQNHCIQLADMTENCNGRYMCSVYVSNPFLMNCRAYANYMQINYTCVPAPFIHDICEAVSLSTKNPGYIRSPHYPSANYSANQHCACRLKTLDPGVQLNILDFSINETYSSQLGVRECRDDYLWISSRGRRCGVTTAERLPETIDIPRRSVLLEFRSDHQYQARGFWIEFKGSQGGRVFMSCGQVQKPDPEEPEHSGEGEVIVTSHAATTLNSLPPSSTERSKEVTSASEENLLVIDNNNGFQMFEFPTSQETPTPRSRPEAQGHEVNDLNLWQTVYPVNSIEDNIVTEKQKETRTSSESENNPDNIDVKNKDSQHKYGKEEGFFETYDFDESPNALNYKINQVQIISGIVVGILILIAIIIIIVLVFRK